MKIKLLVLIIVLVLNNANCFASTTMTTDSNYVPYYISISTASANITINGNSAFYSAQIIPNSNRRISKVVMTLKLINGNNSIVQTKTSSLTLVNGRFSMNNIKQLNSRGTYHASYVARIYDGNTLIESVSGKSTEKRY